MKFLAAVVLLWSLSMAFVAVDASAEPSCVIGGQTILPISFVGPGERPTVPATIDGQPASALIDTESAVTTLNRRALDKLGIKVLSSATNYPGVNVLTANVPNVTVGPVSAKGWFTVLESSDDIGIKLGANYLAKNDVEIWWANKEVRFSSPTGCRKTFLASWNPNAHIAPFDIDPSGRDRRAWFKVRINGKDVNAIIATGTADSYLDLHTAARLGITPESAGVAEDGEAVGWREKRLRVWRAPLADMSIGSYKLANATIRLMDLSLSGEMLVLGADFLRNHRVLISMSQRRLYISHLGGASFSRPAAPPDPGERRFAQAN